MSSIGQYTFRGWDGRIHYGERRIDSLQPEPGVDGSETIIDGWDSSEDDITTSVDLPTLAAGLSLIEGYRALHGRQVTVIEPVGIRWENVEVKRCKITPPDLVIGPAYRVIARWTLITPEQIPTGAL